MTSTQARLAGQTALVTGASRGIGRAIAERLAADGARVIGTATSTSGAEAIGALLRAHGGEGRVLDVRDASACEALIDAIGPVSILVNNAGVTRDTLLLRMKDEDWSQVLETDLTAVFRLSRAVLRGMMKARYGRIINIGSVVGAMGNPGQANYCAAKAGLVGFSKALAQEMGSRGITVNVVAPGFIETDMTAALPEEARQGLLARVPVQRLGRPEDIAAAVAFLASAEASYITGATLHVNGGLYMD
ncbi:3-oxoacyl-[acyl-carrier-protein] reductase [Fontimonas thermophila]|uniref:3-oxoacyl-[acyl-carrier-protein] reductase n=1 Tax=Fontimonas thermophila TaxID=1076937 RepID=A0A1I2HQV7_9GAMM|nr:3-oxoacyl-ACP reductase FabG [Fontimonas thermophila]SFF32504.1 3-oxoacyl-[acyl-carrier-protein] reductase [Fontimonas thermophila]